jgi:hypothetical protein
MTSSGSIMPPRRFWRSSRAGWGRSGRAGIRGPGLGRRPGGLPELVVRGLREDDARALLESALTGPLDARVRDQFIAETRGNPLALLELPRGLTAEQLAGGFGLPGALPLPRRIEESFRRRVDDLQPRTAAADRPHQGVQPGRAAADRPHQRAQPRAAAADRPHQGVQPRAATADRPHQGAQPGPASPSGGCVEGEANREGLTADPGSAGCRLGTCAVSLSTRPASRARPAGHPNATSIAVLVNGGWLPGRSLANFDPQQPPRSTSTRLKLASQSELAATAWRSNPFSCGSVHVGLRKQADLRASTHGPSEPVGRHRGRGLK